MSYSLYVYAPTDGVYRLQITMYGSTTTVAPLGTGTACYERGFVSSSDIITINTIPNTGYSFYRWVINEGGTTRYSYDENFSYQYSGSASTVWLRVETQQQQIYYVTVAFNANGGTGAPASVSNQGYTELIYITLPTTYPTRSGYTFLGWSITRGSTTAEYSPGMTYQFWGNTTGYTHTLYAVWSRASSGGAYVFQNGVFKNATVYIYSGGWKRATPYIFDGSSWKICR